LYALAQLPCMLAEAIYTGVSNILQSYLKLLFLMTIVHWYIRGHIPEVSFIINDREHHMRYYLIDGIYPSWLVFVKYVLVLQ
jgi:hypothetical protein